MFVAPDFHPLADAREKLFAVADTLVHAVSLSSFRVGMESPGQGDLRSHLGVAKPFTVERLYACDVGGDRC